MNQYLLLLVESVRSILLFARPERSQLCMFYVEEGTRIKLTQTSENIPEPLLRGSSANYVRCGHSAIHDLSFLNQKQFCCRSQYPARPEQDSQASTYWLIIYSADVIEMARQGKAKSQWDLQRGMKEKEGRIIYECINPN